MHAINLHNSDLHSQGAFIARLVASDVFALLWLMRNPTKASSVHAMCKWITHTLLVFSLYIYDSTFGDYGGMMLRYGSFNQNPNALQAYPLITPSTALKLTRHETVTRGTRTPKHETPQQPQCYYIYYLPHHNKQKTSGTHRERTQRSAHYREHRKCICIAFISSRLGAQQHSTRVLVHIAQRRFASGESYSLSLSSSDDLNILQYAQRQLWTELLPRSRRVQQSDWRGLYGNCGEHASATD